MPKIKVKISKRALDAIKRRKKVLAKPKKVKKHKIKKWQALT